MDEFYANRSKLNKIDAYSSVWKVVVNGQLVREVDCLGMLKDFKNFIGDRTIAYHSSQNAIDYHRLTRIYSACSVPNPFPASEEWLNTGVGVASRIFGPKSSSLVTTTYWKLEILYNDMWTVGDVTVAPLPDSRVVNIPADLEFGSNHRQRFVRLGVRITTDQYRVIK
jgi:hypothetical protein